MGRMPIGVRVERGLALDNFQLYLASELVGGGMQRRAAQRTLRTGLENTAKSNLM